MEQYEKLKKALAIDCGACSGLCCVALYCVKTDGFPANKEPGTPCSYLEEDFRCNIHPQLSQKGLRGCMAYDCFGAGQKVTRFCYSGADWKSQPHKADEIFQTFLMVFQLHQMAWYLLQAWELATKDNAKTAELWGFREEIERLILENEQMTAGLPVSLGKVDLDGYQANVNRVLRKISGTMAGNSSVHEKDLVGKRLKGKNFDYKDLSMGLLIAADLEGCSLRNTNLLGADLRDANVKNTDLSSTLFLTQMQVNTAIGNGKTKLPAGLTLPEAWVTQ